MNIITKLKMTYSYYKSLGKKKTDIEQANTDINIRSDYIAFLTCPYPVLESEMDNYKQNSK